jgi:hypothetical protein
MRDGETAHYWLYGGRGQLGQTVGVCHLGGLTRGQSGYACATTKLGEKGSVLDMGQDTVCSV